MVGMSVKKHYEVITHEVTEKVCVRETTYCDICKKEIDTNKGSWELTTGHHDWGRDSVDSVEHFDVCSEACLTIKFAEYVNESGKNDWNTMYFEVERT